MQRIGDGTLDVLVDRTYPSEDSGAAHRDLESRRRSAAALAPVTARALPIGTRIPRDQERHRDHRSGAVQPVTPQPAADPPAGGRSERTGPATSAAPERAARTASWWVATIRRSSTSTSFTVWARSSEGGHRRSRFLGAKIKVSGRLSGKWRSRGPAWRMRASVRARVLAGQGPPPAQTKPNTDLW